MTIQDFFVWVFGGDEPHPYLSWGQVAMRAVAVYAISLVLVRIGKSRLISRVSALDVLLAFVLGSLLSRGITGSASISNTIVATAALIALHYVLTRLACYSHAISNLVKGHSRILVSEGVVNEDNLRISHISKDDLLEGLRLHGNCEDPAEVKAAYKERSGERSVIPRKKTPQILEIKVEEGVQRIRIEWMN